MVETNDYYAFGGRWDRSGSLVDQSNCYRYNDKEEQATFGTPYSDYGARQYSSASGRWLAVDPLAEEYYSTSPYAFCNNNPVNYVDPDGLSPSNCISNIIVMIHINHIFSPDAFPESKQISETDFYYYYYTGDLSFEFDDGKISVRYVTLGDVCAQLRDICLELETECNVKRMLEFTEGEGIITFERQDETIFIHPDFIPSENSSYVSAAPEDYGFYVPFNEFYNEVKRFYSCVAAVIWASDSHTKNYLTEWE